MRTKNSGRPLRGPFDLPQCTTPDLRRSLVPYALGRYDEEHQSLFEAHILECDLCFEDLKSLDRTRSLIDEFIESDPKATAAARSRLRRRRLLQAALVSALALVSVLAGFVLGRHL